MRHDLLLPVLSEKQYRLYLAAEVKAFGWGGASKVAQVTNSSRNTISSGLKELEGPPIHNPVEDKTNDKKVRRKTRGRRLPVDEAVRQRRSGGGRKRTADVDPTLKTDLDALLEPFAAGDPCSPLRWTCKSISALTTELICIGHKTSTRMVHELLLEMRYTMQANRKTKESGSHPDRNDQFIFINEKVKAFQKAGERLFPLTPRRKSLWVNFQTKEAHGDHRDVLRK